MVILGHRPGRLSHVLREVRITAADLLVVAPEEARMSGLAEGKNRHTVVPTCGLPCV
ncbi:MAG: hypothetical protein PVH62_00010 [Anaerolineae bacterium]